MAQQVDQGQQVDHEPRAPEGQEAPLAKAPVAEGPRMSRAEQEERESSRMDVLMTQDRERYGARWEQIQSSFVDEPRKAVEEADRLRQEVVQQLTRMCADEREQLERRWSGDGTDTEAMRTTLQGYRRLFSFVLR